MITQTAALLSCIELLQSLMSGADNDTADTIDACLQQANEALTTPQEITVHYAVIDHRHGMNDYCSLDQASLNSKLADFCRESWHEQFDPEEGPIPEDHAEIIEQYFDRAGDAGFGDGEYLQEFEHTLTLPSPPTDHQTTNPVPAD